MFTITVIFTVKEAHAEDFKSLLLKQAHDSLNKELACRVFDVSISTTKDGLVSFFLYELYDTEADFKAHLTSDHFVNFNQVSAEFVVSKVVNDWQKIT